MTILQENGRANGATDGLAEATLGSYRTLMEGDDALHELNTKLAARWIGGLDGTTRTLERRTDDAGCRA